MAVRVAGTGVQNSWMKFQGCVLPEDEVRHLRVFHYREPEHLPNKFPNG
jgi:hypothetical protein